MDVGLFRDSDGAIRELRTALHLMPFEPLRHINFIGMGCAHFLAERYDRAALWIQSAVEAYPGSYWAQLFPLDLFELADKRARRDLSRRIALQSISTSTMRSKSLQIF
jgi:hypothetical protein